MRLNFIVCKVLQREAYLCASRSQNIVNVHLMPQGLHDEPDRLRSELQAALGLETDLQGRHYDACVLGYGLCSNGVVGLTTPLPLVIPRAHDCITLLLGSKERYQRYFESHRGIYWYSAGWIEHSLQPGRERYERTLNRYREKYGPDNAEYLMRMEQNWMSEYCWATYIDWGLPNSDYYRSYTKQCAEFLGWNYDELKGDPYLLQRLLDGEWDEEHFLRVEPGHRIEADLTTEGLLKAPKCTEECLGAPSCGEKSGAK